MRICIPERVCEAAVCCVEEGKEGGRKRKRTARVQPISPTPKVSLDLMTKQTVP
jgi:hypothetical protein